MLNRLPMNDPNHGRLVSAIFITFSGNCRKALTYYQACFGGSLQFETFGQEVGGYPEKPVISGSLVSDRIIIHGSDLVHAEGRILGNYLSVFLHCKDKNDRQALVEKLGLNEQHLFAGNDDDQKLVEVTDAFHVRWVLGI